MKAFKKFRRNFKICLIAILAIYGFVMYKYSFMNNTYTSSDGMITLGQKQEELSLDTNTNEETNTEEVSEEASKQVVQEQAVEKNYDLNSVLGREEYIWDFLIKCRFLTSSNSSYNWKSKRRKCWFNC